MAEILKVVEGLLSVLKEFKAAEIIAVLEKIDFTKLLEILKSVIDILAKLK